MTTSVPLKCRCGTLRGIAEQASASTVNRLVCYCVDCQTYARWLEVPGVLDPLGGTEIVQQAPSRVKITAGEGALACVRLSPKGLFRFYASCCRTPVANMLGPRVPFTGVVHSFMDFGGDGRPRDDALGPIVGRVHGRYAIGGVPPGADARASFGVIVRTVGIMAGWRLRGLRAPTPFFNEQTSAPSVAPSVLTLAERERHRSHAA